MTNLGHLLSAAVLPVVLVLTGCASNPQPTGTAQQVTPNDFVNPGVPASAGEDTTTDASPREVSPTRATTPAPLAHGSAHETAPPAPASTMPPPHVARHGALVGDTYTLDAMVGQVNGQAIYADDVLKPMHEDLVQWSRKLSRGEFHRRVRQAIHARLEQKVANALILGAAQRDLTDGDRARLDYMVQLHRDELLRQYGLGSVSLAEHNLKQRTGKTLAQTLEDYRRGFVVQGYLRKKLLPKINVSRRDVERYYRDHPDAFHEPPQRVLRLIRTDTQAAATTIGGMLKKGVPFEKVAGDKLNLNRPNQGGLMSPIVGDHAFSSASLNQAVNGLTRGKWAGPVHVGDAWLFVYLESYTPAKATSLEQAQIDIKNKLTEEQYQRLTVAYRDQLFKQGSYNSLSGMTDDLVRIAMNRY